VGKRNSNMTGDITKKRFLRFPVMSWGAEALTMGYLMRRNILTFKSPPNNEGHDLICLHPDPRQRTRQLRIQVKSRYATDCDRGFPVKEASLDAFDFLVVVFLNVGRFSGNSKRGQTGKEDMPEFYTFPRSFIKRHIDTQSTWQKVRLGKLTLARYKNAKGFEAIARRLRIPYPGRTSRVTENCRGTPRPT
jgi:hypothetical protein